MQRHLPKIKVGLHRIRRRQHSYPNALRVHFAFESFRRLSYPETVMAQRSCDLRHNCRLEDRTSDQRRHVRRALG